MSKLPRFRPGQSVRIHGDASAVSSKDAEREGEVVALRPSDDSATWLVSVDVLGHLEEVLESELAEVSAAVEPLFPIILEERAGLRSDGPLREELFRIVSRAFDVSDHRYEERHVDALGTTIASLRCTPASVDSVSGFETLIAELGRPDDLFDDGWSAEAHWTNVGVEPDRAITLSVALRPWEFLKRREIVL